MPYVKNGDVNIYYNDLGEGEPAILYMAGWCDSRNSFTQFTFACARNRRVIALDWRGHGRSDKPKSDFGLKELTQDALKVIEASGINNFIPVAKANGGWIAIELKKRIPDRIPKMVFIDWHIFDPPISFMNLLKSLQNPKEYENARRKLFDLWLQDVDHPDVIRLINQEMASYEFPMWAKAAREIEAAYKKYGSPLDALNSLESHVPVLHLYSQPDEHAYLASQENFSESNDWFKVKKLNLKSHFLTVEVPEYTSHIVEGFITQDNFQAKATGT